MDGLRELVYAMRNAIGEDSGPGRSVEARTLARQAEQDLLEGIAAQRGSVLEEAARAAEALDKPACAAAIRALKTAT